MARSSRSTVLLAAAAAGVSLAALARAVTRRARRFVFEGRVAVVTGGSRGLGLRIAEELGRRGARVALCGRDASAVAKAEQLLRDQGIEVLARPCDLGDRRQAEAFIEDVAARWGRVDVLVNNAGAIRVEPAATTTVESLEEVMRNNFFSALYTTFAALPHLRAQDASRIVNITSIGGQLAVPHLLGYTASKFAMQGFSEGISVELGRAGFGRGGLRVVTVVPGLMRTGSYHNAVFGGRADRELAWFSVSASLPFVTVSAARAARRIVLAIERGERLVHVGWPAAVASLVHGLAPRLTMRATALVGRLLPAPQHYDDVQRGRDIGSPLKRSRILALGERAARQNNEDPYPVSR